MKPINLTPQEQTDPYLATAIEAHDRAWEEVLDRQEEARDKWQTMNKEQVDKLLERQQSSLDRYKEARASLQQKRSLARARRLRAAGGAVSVAIAGSSCESTPRRGWVWCPHASDQRREEQRALNLAGCASVLAAIAATA